MSYREFSPLTTYRDFQSSNETIKKTTAYTKVLYEQEPFKYGFEVVSELKKQLKSNLFADFG